MDYNAFAKKIHKSNKKMHMVTVMILCFVTIAIIQDTSEAGSIFGVMDYIVPIFLMIVITWDFFGSYMKFAGRSFAVGSSHVTVATSLSDLAAVHSIDYKKYFRRITGNMMPIMCILAICEIAGFILYHNIYYVIYTVLCFVIPLVTIFVIMKIYEYDTCHLTGVNAMMIIRTLLAGLIFGVKVFIISFCSSVCILFGSKIFTTDSLSEMNDMIAYQSYPHSLTRIIIFLAFIFALTFLDLVKTKFEFMGKIRVGLMVVIIGLMITNVYLARNYYNIFQEDSILICENGQEKEYTYDEVTAFTIYEDDSWIKMRLDMKDGKRVEVFGAEAGYTDKYVEEFYGDYNFAAYLAEKLDALGIKGKLEGADKLMDYVRESDSKEDAKGWQKIKEVMGIS